MKKPIKESLILILALSLFVFILNATQQNAIPFPNDYEQFKEIKIAENNSQSMLNNIIPKGLYKVAMDSLAYSYYQRVKSDSTISTNSEYPNGARIVLIQYEDKDMKKPNLLLLMEKNRAFKQTKNWAWQGYKLSDKKAFISNWVTQCANCHFNKAQNHDFTFMLSR